MKALVICDLGHKFREEIRHQVGTLIIRPDEFSSIVDEELRETAVLVLRSGFRIDSPALERLPNLQLVVRAGSGTDNIDESLLNERGVRLVTRPAVSAAAVAELMLWGALRLVGLARPRPLGVGRPPARRSARDRVAPEADHQARPAARHLTPGERARRRSGRAVARHRRHHRRGRRLLEHAQRVDLAPAAGRSRGRR